MNTFKKLFVCALSAPVALAVTPGLATTVNQIHKQAFEPPSFQFAQNQDEVEVEIEETIEGDDLPDDQDTAGEEDTEPQDDLQPQAEQEPETEEQPSGQVNPQPAQTEEQEPTQPQGQAQGETQGQPAAGGPIRQQVLSRHNQLRANHCVPALAWSSRLAATAQDWANRCVFEHRPGNLGENLAIGTSGAFPPASQVQSWYDEIRSYDFATGASRDGQAVGHFTQVIWRGTRQLGCAVASCNGQDLLVCNYSPAGNLTGAYQENVPQRCR